MHKPLSDRGWSADFSNIHPAFEQIPAEPRQLPTDSWPGCDYLNSLLLPDVCNLAGAPLRFAPQDASLPWPALYYEQRIAQYGVIATRNNWHDFFNAMIWCLFPNSKASISALHAADFDPAAAHRTRQRDALTLFDENGALIVSSSVELLQAIINFDWQTVFVSFRNAWHRKTECRIIGHALFEKLLTPYLGLTANTRLVLVPDAYFEMTAALQRQFLDRCVADALAKKDFQSPKCLSPFPLLGIPGWWINQDRLFYANADYFRAKSYEREATILTLSL